MITIFETMFIAHAQDDGWMDQEYFFSSRCKRSTLTVMASTSDSLPLVGSYTSKHLLLDVFTKLKIFRYWRIDRVIQSVIFTLCPKGTGTLHYSARLSKTRWFPLLPTFPSSSLSQVAVGKKYGRCWQCSDPILQDGLDQCSSGLRTTK